MNIIFINFNLLFKIIIRLFILSFIQGLEFALKIFNYFFTSVFILEASMKIVALGLYRYMRERWVQMLFPLFLLFQFLFCFRFFEGADFIFFYSNITSYFFFFRWNQLDIAIVILSVVGIVLEEMESNVIPMNPTIIRVMRVLRIARGKLKEISLIVMNLCLQFKSRYKIKVEPLYSIRSYKFQ